MGNVIDMQDGHSTTKQQSTVRWSVFFKIKTLQAVIKGFSTFKQIVYTKVEFYFRIASKQILGAKHATPWSRLIAPTDHTQSMPPPRTMGSYTTYIGLILKLPIA